VPPEAGDEVQRRAVAAVAASAADVGFVPLASLPEAAAVVTAAAPGGADALTASAWLALLDAEPSAEEGKGVCVVTHPCVADDDAGIALPHRAAAQRVGAPHRAAAARALSPDLFSDSEEEEAEEAAPAEAAAAQEQDVEVPNSPPAATAAVLFAAAKAQLPALAALWGDPRALACELVRCDPFLSDLAALCA
jgi:hypothetical protein